MASKSQTASNPNVVPIGVMDAEGNPFYRVSRHPWPPSNSTVANDTSGGGGGGDMSDWKSTVETRISELRTDVRNLLIGGMIAIAAIIGTGWTLYGKTSDQIREVSVGQQAVSGKLDTIDTRIGGKLELLAQRLEVTSVRRSESKQGQ